MHIEGVFWWEKITLGAPGAPKSLQHLMVPDYGNISEDIGTN